MTPGSRRSRRAFLAGVGAVAVGGSAVALGGDRSDDPPSTRRTDLTPGRTYLARNSRPVRDGDASVEQLLMATPAVGESGLYFDVVAVTATGAGGGGDRPAALNEHRLGARSPGDGTVALYDEFPESRTGSIESLHGAAPTTDVDRSAVASAVDSSPIDGLTEPRVTLVPEWDRASGFETAVVHNLSSLRDALLVVVSGGQEATTDRTTSAARTASAARTSATDEPSSETVLVVPASGEQETESGQFGDGGHWYAWRPAESPWRAHVVRYAGLYAGSGAFDLLLRQETRLAGGTTVRHDFRLSRETARR